MKNCLYCGRENADEAIHCHECGTSEFAISKPPLLQQQVDRAGDNITSVNQLWDFIFGVTVITGTPIAVSGLITVVVSFVADLFSASGNSLVLLLATILVFGSGTAAFVFACLWRCKHRLLPARVFPFGVIAALVIVGMYYFVFVIIGYAAYGAD